MKDVGEPMEPRTVAPSNARICTSTAVVVAVKAGGRSSSIELVPCTREVVPPIVVVTCSPVSVIVGVFTTHPVVVKVPSVLVAALEKTSCEATL